MLLDRYAPPGVVVDEDLQIVQFRGQTGPYLEPAPGDPSLNLLKMAREGLLHGLRSIFNEVRLQRAFRSAGAGSASSRTAVGTPSPSRSCRSTRRGKRHFLVLFEPGENGADVPRLAMQPASEAPVASDVDQRVRTLEDELAASRSTCSRSSRSWRRPTRSCSRRTRRSSPATRSCSPPTRSSTPPRRSCSRPTRS